MNFKSLATLFLCLLTLSAFGQSPKSYSFNEGDKFKVNAVVEQKIEQTMFGQVMETTQKISTTDLYEVVAVSSEGYRLKTTGLSRSFQTISSQGTVSMDSDMEGDEHLAFRTLKGKSYFIDMNIYGKALSMQGLDELKADIISELKGTPLESSAEQLTGAFEEESLMTSFNGQFFIYQMPGEPWQNNFETMVNSLPIQVDLQFEYSSTNEIQAKGKMLMTGEFEVSGQQMGAEMQGDQTSNFKISPDTGLSYEIITNQKLEGNLEVQDIKVPMVLNTSVKVTIIK